MVGVGSLLVGSLLVGLPLVGLLLVGSLLVGSLLVGSLLVGSLLVGSLPVAVGVAAAAEGVGVGDCVGAATGQVNADVFVYTGCADDCWEMTGEGVAVADEVAEPLDWSAKVGFVLVTTGSALGLHLAAEECDFAAFDFCDVAEVFPVLPVSSGAGLADDGPVPYSTDRVPLPSVPAVFRCDPLPPPCNAVPAWRMAFRNGRTPIVTLAMTAIAAKTAASRNDQLPHAGKLPCRNRGHRASASRDSHPGWAQCPRHVQFRTRSATPKRTLNNQGRGGRPAIRVWILSSPSLPGSTSLAASDRARRSASSRPSSSGEVMPSPHLLATSAITTPAPILT